MVQQGKTGISKVSLNFCSIIKQSGAAISSRLIPPNVPLMFLIVSIIEFGSLLSISIMQGINAKVRKNPKRVIFAEGEDENMLKAAIEFGRNKLGIPILIGAENRVREQLKKIGLDENYKIEIVNSTDKEKRINMLNTYIKNCKEKVN